MAAPNDIIPNDSSELPQVGSLLGGRFLLQEVVANPSLGVVYKASDSAFVNGHADSPQVAVRILGPELAEQDAELRALQREVTKMRCLSHPHIARFIEFDHEDGHHYLAVEWLEGRTLASILDSAESRHINRDYALRIVRQLGEALDYAHRCGIVHGGIDPAKIMIMRNGDARLFDFGLANFRQRLLMGREEPGVPVVGAMAYSSLQVLGGDTPVTSDDVFSLACLLYRLVAGHRVFGPRDAADAHQAEMVPERPQGFTDSQWIAMSRALSYSRKTRYHYVKELVGALEVGSAAHRSGEVEKQLSAGGLAAASHRWILAAVTGLALLAGVTVMPDSVEPEADPVAAPAVNAPGVNLPTTAAEPTFEVPLPINTSAEPTVVVPEVIEQRRAKPALPLNAIGFSADRVFVDESDPAVTIDVMRFNADDQSLSIRYTVESLSAIEGDDYFAPGSSLLTFAPRQRTARVLVPLVQDSVVEGEERFVLRLANTAATSSVYGHQHILVTIRADDPQAP